jgi:hypothetical protein
MWPYRLLDVKGDGYVSRVVRTIEESCQLVDAGFKYVCETDGAKIFMKRK